MSIFRGVDVMGSGSDLVRYLRQQREHRWLLAILACAPPAFIIALFNMDLLDTSKPGEPEVTYIQSWPADRSLKDIIESNVAAQKVKDEQEARAREAYKALGRAAGMDVDKIERDAEAERTKAKAATAGAAK
jgi:hypothetical protein